MGNKNKQEGFLTLEVVISIGLVAMFLSGALALSFSNQSLVIDTVNNHIGLQKAQGGFGEAQAQGFDFAGNTPVVENGFTQEGGFIWLSDYAKQIFSRSSYFSLSRAQAVEIDGLVMDKTDVPGRDTCDLYLKGDWSHPKTRGSVSGPGGVLGKDVDVLNGVAYVAADGNSSAPDFFAVDVSSPDAPYILAQLNTGPGLRQLHAAGAYVFAANAGVDQLHIINISNPAAPAVSKKIKMSSYVAAADGKGRSVYYSGYKVFVGLEKNSGPEFFVFDVSSPLSPLYLGSFEAGSVVSSIYVYGNLAYITTGDEKRLKILDISNPSAIFEAAAFVPNAGNTVQAGESLAVLGDNIFLGRAAGLPSAGIAELYALDKNNLSAALAPVDLNSSINGMFYRVGLLFLAVKPSGANKAFEVFSFENGALNRIGQVDLIADATGLDCEGSNMFSSLDSNVILEVITPQ